MQFKIVIPNGRGFSDPNEYSFLAFNTAGNGDNHMKIVRSVPIKGHTRSVITDVPFVGMTPTNELYSADSWKSLIL